MHQLRCKQAFNFKISPELSRFQDSSSGHLSSSLIEEASAFCCSRTGLFEKGNRGAALPACQMCGHCCDQSVFITAVSHWERASSVVTGQTLPIRHGRTPRRSPGSIVPVEMTEGMQGQGGEGNWQGARANEVNNWRKKTNELLNS